MELKHFIGEKIKSYRKLKKLTQTDLADMLGTTKQTISRYEKGERKADQDVLFALVDIFGVTIDDFFPAQQTTSSPSAKVIQLDRDLKDDYHTRWVTKGDSLLQEQTLRQAQLETQQAQEASEVHEEQVEYHVYERLSAGRGTGYTEGYNYDTVYYDEDISHDLASWIYGDSMEPAYLNGEVALIKATGFDYDGAVYAIDWAGQTYIKKVYKEKDGLRLVSLNKKYAPLFAHMDEEPRIIGKVVGHFMPMEV